MTIVGTNSFTERPWDIWKRSEPMIGYSCRELDYLFDGKLKHNMIFNEDEYSRGGNDNYRDSDMNYQATNTYGSVSLPLEYLIRDETCSLVGNISDASDVDYYNFYIPYPKLYQNNYGVEINMDIPEGADYDLTLYDEYGNQVGKADWNGEGRKSLEVPFWDTKTTKYCFRIEDKEGKEVKNEDTYRISFHVNENKDEEKTEKVRNAFFAMNDAKCRHSGDYDERKAEYDNALKEAESNYTKEVESLHKKQFESLPEEKQYKGSKTLDELLNDMSEGKVLSDAENEYVKIFANVRDYQKAKNNAGLRGNFSKKFNKDLKARGISEKDAEGMHVKIKSDGTVNVSGTYKKEIAGNIAGLVKAKYSKEMYRYYVGGADSLLNLPWLTYQYALDVQETRRYLKGLIGKDISFKDLYFRDDTSIGGLPGKADSIINNTKNNVKIESVRDALKRIIWNIKLSGDIGIPDFTSEFVYKDGKFSVLDSGFNVDMDKVYERLVPETSGGTYKYGFKKVL